LDDRSGITEDCIAVVVDDGFATAQLPQIKLMTAAIFMTAAKVYPKGRRDDVDDDGFFCCT
jgi:hypothetical protein